MNRFILLFIIILSCTANRLIAQTLFVDAVKGKDEAKGTLTDPLASLEKAIVLAGSFSGLEPVTIKIYPGLYSISHQLEVKTGKLLEDTVKYSIEAAILPDHPDWQPAFMPVIQSRSFNNSSTQFTHAVGFQVAKPNVRFRGLKFIGSAEPSVSYYYPITRENETYSGLEISQCYFIGEKNSAPIQGAIWAHGAGIHVDHCIFYGCKNALLLFRAVKDFSLTYSVIYGAYEAAVWYAPTDVDFEFHNNIISRCEFFWARPENSSPAYIFSNSIITDVNHYMGFFGRGGLVPVEKNNHKERGIKRSGKVLLSETTAEGVPRDYLNPTAASDGYELKAGVFKGGSR